MRKIKMIGQRKPKRNSHKSISNCPENTAQQLRYSPPDSACVFIHMHCTLFLLINTSLASLLSVFLEILFCKAKGPGPCHWSLVYWLGSGAFNHFWIQPQFLAWKLSPTPSKLRTLEIRTITTIKKIRLGEQTMCLNSNKLSNKLCSVK